ncbi:Lsr2 family protein [Streptomyces ficellus]|uniref:Lsr2 family protein n=1 Tax=Streptomyces ficellus TaxID=1977088 RepID=A0ABT7ZBL0_9ACTN|nr:Lsr2 family protein [Streptomyces ficellus]MDN3296426.1 Lsr2 family protein [Streptomyces ficellus]
MAQRVVVTLFDDIDGGEAAETVTFGLDGKSYEIDLNPANAKKLRKALAPYLAAGRKQSGAGNGAGSSSGGGGSANGRPRASYTRTALEPDPAAVRAWAQSHKLAVPARGRIPKHVYEAFREAC